MQDFELLLPDHDAVKALLRPYVVHCRKRVEHIMQVRTAPYSDLHFEFAVSTVCNVPAGMEVLEILVLAWAMARTFDASWTLFCQGTLPDVDFGNSSLPFLQCWETARDIEIAQEPFEHDKDNILKLRELKEKEWAELLEVWDT